MRRPGVRNVRFLIAPRTDELAAKDDLTFPTGTAGAPPGLVVDRTVAIGGQPFAVTIDLVAAEQATKRIDQLGYYGCIVAGLGCVEQNPSRRFTRACHCTKSP